MKTVALLSILLGLTFGQNCLMTVPQAPLTSIGLATPYLLKSADAACPCSMLNTGASFVQAVVADLDTGALYVYNPLVIDDGTTPAIPPVVPQLPANNVVGIWFGSNGNTLTLVDSGGSLTDGQCVNGADGTVFGQFAYCNAPAFFAAVNPMVASGKIQVPLLAQAVDKQPCPTSRSFFVVDQDQSDNLPTNYLISQKGTLAQNTLSNRNALKNATVLGNGSDEGLVVLMDRALGCSPWLVRDLADPTQTLASLALNEIFAQNRQPPPVAKIPGNDPMVVNGDGQPDLNKVNAYRVGVNQNQIISLASLSTFGYCRNLGTIFPTRIMNPTVAVALQQAPSPDPCCINLYTFLANRYTKSWAAGTGLDCAGILGVKSAISVTTTGGIVTGVAVNKSLILTPFGDADNGFIGTETLTGTTMTSEAYTTVFTVLFALIACVIVF